MQTRIVHDYLQVNGGAERLVITLAQDLPRACLTVSGLYPDFLQSASTRLNGIDLRVIPTAQWLPRIPRALAAFATSRTLFPGDECIIYSGVFAPLSARYQQGGKCIYYCHTPPRFAFDRTEQYLRRVARPFRPLLQRAIARYRSAYLDALRRMDVVVTNSRHIRSRLREQTGIAAEVIYPPIDTARFRWRGVGDYYLSLGRLEPNKRVQDVIKAFLQMPDKKLVVASGGSGRGELEGLAANAHNIVFTGWIDDERLAELIGNAIACIYIAHDEDFGMSPVEAMSAGKPVIGVDQGGLKETVVHGETGLLLQGDPTSDDLIRAINALDPDAALTMRTACERRSRQFARERFVEAITDLLQ